MKALFLRKEYHLFRDEGTKKKPKVLIMGLGLHGGGAGAARFFAKRGCRVTVTDLKHASELAQSVKELQRLSSRIQRTFFICFCSSDIYF